MRGAPHADTRGMRRQRISWFASIASRRGTKNHVRVVEVDLSAPRAFWPAAGAAIVSPGSSVSPQSAGFRFDALFTTKDLGIEPGQ